MTTKIMKISAKRDNLYAMKTVLRSSLTLIPDGSIMKTSIVNRSHKVLRCLLEDGRCIPEDICIVMAIRLQDVTSLSLLLIDRRADPSAYDNQAILNAVRTKNPLLVKLLLIDGRVDPNIKGGLPMQMAIHLGASSVVKLLLSDKRTNSRGYIKEAMGCANRNIFRVILTANAIRSK